MDTRRLHTFVRIVEIGSLTRAADILHVAQPALSQQINGLEAEVGQRLLIRSKQGVSPTEAGVTLYRHAQVILKQVGDALAEVELSGREVAGQVSLGLAPFSTADLIAIPLLTAVRERYPRIVLRIADSSGVVLSEAMMTGRLDLAVLFNPGPIRGLVFEGLASEDLCLVCRQGASWANSAAIPVTALAELPLMMPGPTHTVRQAAQAAFAEAGVTPNVVAELESINLVGGAVVAGLGATLLPATVAARLTEHFPVRMVPVAPAIEVHLCLGAAANLPLSRAAECVRELLRRIVSTMF